MDNKLIFLSVTTACVLSACETVYVAPAAGPTAQLTTVYEPAGLHAVAQVRHYPNGTPSDFRVALMKDLGGEAVQGRAPTYSETYSIPAGKDFHFGFQLIAPGHNPTALPELIASTCTVNMRLRPEERQHYQVVFASSRDRCTTQVFRIVRGTDGAPRRVPDVSAVKIVWANWQ